MRCLARKKLNKTREKWPLIILYDDREKKGRWHINHHKYVFEKRRLKTGDYTIEGYEHLIAVERKANFQEFIGNITGRKRRKFEKYIERLSQYLLPVLVIEDNLGSLPGVFRALKYSGLNEEKVYQFILRIQCQYCITVIFMDCNKIEKEVFLYHLFEQLQLRADKIRGQK